MVTTGLSVLVAIVGSSWLFLIRKKRKLFNMKKKFFRRNRGLLLQQEVSEQQISIETVRIYSVEELKNTTKNYDESHIIGKGGFNTVYKGCCLETEVPLLVYEFVSNGTVYEHIHYEDKASLISWEIWRKILDDKVAKERDIEHIKKVYELTKRCLRVKGCCEMIDFGEQCGGNSKSDRQSKYVRQSKSGGQANVTNSLSVRQNGRQSNHQLP
ncbi:hypothetical protein Gohar_008564 [Gossypium harknessii]|uniref:Protein kinase domain-containing protein n=1 Tax=Gossypium harknessii TaxID=34285 RepID=A0A7J9GLC9_9ROSI|nr:hypothetical protein [Gossypium harknessii]